MEEQEVNATVRIDVNELQARVHDQMTQTKLSSTLPLLTDERTARHSYISTANPVQTLADSLTHSLTGESPARRVFSRENGARPFDRVDCSERERRNTRFGVRTQRKLQFNQIESNCTSNKRIGSCCEFLAFLPPARHPSDCPRTHSLAWRSARVFAR